MTTNTYTPKPIMRLDDIVNYVTFSGSINAAVNLSGVAATYDTGVIYHGKR